MASADLRKELECSVCLSLYTDPVTLKCGHNFCHQCIDRVLETQGGSGRYSCPECREEFVERPALRRNVTLRNVVENLLSTHTDKEAKGIFCTQCIDSPVPAVKSCLHCEASLCERHLGVHSKSPEHVLTDPSTAPGSRKCSEHKKILEYYCTEDNSCICVSCSLIGEHRGHQMESLDKASEKKKTKLRDVLQKMTKQSKETEGRVQSLQEGKKKTKQKATELSERVTALFRELRAQLDDLERRLLRDISRQAERSSSSISEKIQQLKIKKDELSRKMHHIEELCNMADPLTVLQEPDPRDSCDTEEGDNEDRGTRHTELSDGGDLDMALVSEKLHTLSEIISEVNVGIYREEAADILLDEDTAHNHLQILYGRKTVSCQPRRQNRPETPKRFRDFAQVLSICSVSSGRHYWEVDTEGSRCWRVGVCYPSMQRRGGPQSGIGGNNKSWGLYRSYDQMGVGHDNIWTPLPLMLSSKKVRIDLDYEAGKISFYDPSDLIRHLHTFTTTFTEPLHVGLYVGDYNGCLKIRAIKK